MEELEDGDKKKCVDEYVDQNHSRQHYPEWNNPFKQSDQRLPKVDFPEYAEFT